MVGSLYVTREAAARRAPVLVAEPGVLAAERFEGESLGRVGVDFPKYLERFVGGSSASSSAIACLLGSSASDPDIPVTAFVDEERLAARCVPPGDGALEREAADAFLRAAIVNDDLPFSRDTRNIKEAPPLGSSEGFLLSVT